MSAVTKVVMTGPELPGCVRATVVSRVGDALSLRLATGDAVEARPVLGLPVDPEPGDQVLCVAAQAEGDRRERWIVAVLSTAPGRAVRRALTVEEDPAGTRSVVRLPAGGVRVACDGDLALEATRSLRVESPRVRATVTRAEVDVDHAVTRARRWELVAAQVLQAAEVVETRAARIVSRAKNLFHEVEELAQTHAGRARIVADEELHVHGQRVLVKADDDVKLRGEKVHLG